MRTNKSRFLPNARTTCENRAKSDKKMTAIEMKPLLPPSSSRPAKTSDTASIYTPSTGRSFALWPGRRRAGGSTPDAQAVTCKTNMVTFFLSAMHCNEWSSSLLCCPRSGGGGQRQAAGPCRRQGRWRLLAVAGVRRLQLRGEHVEHDLHVLVPAGLHVLVELQYPAAACITVRRFSFR